MPQMLWTLYFLEAQGYKINGNVLYQDNKSSILAGDQRTWIQRKTNQAHERSVFLYVADRVKSKEIRTEYCPTGIMVADYFTKPLQEMIFQTLRDMIMGNTDIDLPSDTINGTDKTNGIPTISTSQEPRSVLENEIKIEIGRSPRSLLVLSADIKTTDCVVRQKKAHTLKSCRPTIMLSGGLVRS
jgi:hypothetical protein